MTYLLKCDYCGITDDLGADGWDADSSGVEKEPGVSTEHACPECRQSEPMPGGDPVRTHNGWESH